MGDVTPQTVTAQIGRKILLRRKSRGISQCDFAAMAGMSPPHLSNIEQGKRVLTVEVLATIAGHLGCQMADLMPAIPARHATIPDRDEAIPDRHQQESSI